MSSTTAVTAVAVGLRLYRQASSISVGRPLEKRAISRGRAATAVSESRVADCGALGRPQSRAGPTGAVAGIGQGRMTIYGQAVALMRCKGRGSASKVGRASLAAMQAN